MSTAFAFTRDNATLAKLYVVKANKADLNAYLAQQLELWLAANPARTQKGAAKIAGVSEAQLSNLRKGTRGAGIETLRGVARLLGKTWDELEAEAAEYAQRRPKPLLRVAETVVEIDARYPNLVKAIRVRRPDVLEVTVRRISAIALHWPEDRSVGSWIDEIDQLDRQLRRELRTGEASSMPVADEDDVPPLGR
jgi:transcriptional regulator with XRE-family HTH domain